VKWTEPILPTLESIEITTSPTKTSFFVGDILDISGLEVTGHYSDETSKIEEITEESITGFDSSLPATEQILTITFGGVTTTYIIEILEPLPPTQLKIISSPQIIASGTFSEVFKAQSRNALEEETNVLSKTIISLSSDSSTGLFFDASLDGRCDEEKSLNAVTMRSGSANKAFCYKDDTPGIFKIIVSDFDEILLSDFQEIEILETTSPTNQ